MEGGQNIGPCKFDILFKKYVPHVLEKIFFSLDYHSFKICPQVNSTWKELFTTESYEKKRKSVFHDEIMKDEFKLWNAAREGNVEVVRHLLSSIFVDVNCATGEHQTTPLCEATEKGQKEVVEVLLEKGAELDRTGKYGWTPMFFAVRMFPSQTAKDLSQLFLDRGADPSRATNYGLTPLYLAITKGYTDVVQLLLDRGADPNMADPFGLTPLHLAEIILLLNRGADPNKADNNGRIIMHQAARRGDEELVRLLLCKGAERHPIDHLGRTPLALAQQHGYTNIVEILTDVSK